MFWVTPQKTLRDRFAESEAARNKGRIADLERRVKDLEDKKDKAMKEAGKGKA